MKAGHFGIGNVDLRGNSWNKLPNLIILIWFIMFQIFTKRHEVWLFCLPNVEVLCMKSCSLTGAVNTWLAFIIRICVSFSKGKDWCLKNQLSLVDLRSMYINSTGCSVRMLPIVWNRVAVRSLRWYFRRVHGESWWWTHVQNIAIRLYYMLIFVHLSLMYSISGKSASRASEFGFENCRCDSKMQFFLECCSRCWCWCWCCCCCCSRYLKKVLGRLSWVMTEFLWMVF